MAKMVRIQSTVTISVIPGLHNKDVTNPDAHIPDRLKVSALWPKATVMVKKGVGYYPAEIAEWETVKNLVKDGVFTLGEITDDTSSKAEEDTKKLDSAMAELTANETKKSRRKKTESLEDLTEE